MSYSIFMIIANFYILLDIILSVLRFHAELLLSLFAY